MTTTLNVPLGARSYPIFIGTGLLADPACYRPYVAGRQVMIVTNETVAPLYLGAVVGALDGLRVETLVLPDGEVYKTQAVLARIYAA